MVTNEVLNFLYETPQGYRLMQWNNIVFNPQSLQQYAEAISGKGTVFEKLLWFYRWYCETNQLTKVKSTHCFKGELQLKVSLLHMKVLTLIEAKSNVFLWYVQCCSCTGRSKTKILATRAPPSWIECDVTTSNAPSWIWLVIVAFHVPAFIDLL